MSMLSARARRIVRWLPSPADVAAFRARLASAQTDQARAALVTAVERQLRLKVLTQGTCPRCEWIQRLDYDGGPVHPFFCRRCHDDNGMDLVPLLIDDVPLVTKDELPLPSPTPPKHGEP